MGEVVNLQDFRGAKTSQATEKPVVSNIEPVDAVGDVFDYRTMLNGALLSVVRRVLKETATSGLPKKSRLFIKFDTNHPGVKISDHLKTTYPEDMMIMLDAWWEDLFVFDSEFEVTLNFKGERQRICVPFASVLMFADEGAQFALHFKPKTAQSA